MRINHNIAALNTYRQLTINNDQGNKSLEKLSSGMRINRAGDDAAGLAISEKMRGQIRGLTQASRNAQDGISMIQTAEGALNETHSILQRMRELADQSANDTNNDSDRGEIQKEMNQLTSEINRIGNTTEFNTQKLLNTPASGQAEAGKKTVAINGNDFTINAGKENAGDKSNLKIKFTSGAKEGVAYATDTLTVTLDEKRDDYTASDIQGLIQGATVADLNMSKFTVTADGTDKIDATSAGSFAEVSTELAGGKDADPDAVTGFKANLQIGANTGQSFTIDINDMRSEALEISTTDNTTKKKVVVDGTIYNVAWRTTQEVTDGTNDTKNEYALDVSSHDNATAAIKVIDDAINTVSAERSKMGAFQNRLEHTINNLGTSSENLTAAESRIRDVDMAQEMMTHTKNNILAQAAQSMLAQANQQPQNVLQLLR